MPLYLAMTAAEISGCRELPVQLAYMACHFSPYSAGLSNLPTELPKGAMLILNDRIPLCGHDPQLIARQLEQLCKTWEAESLLLDLQRLDENMPSIIEEILQNPVCPVGVSELYAKEFDCPVFISAPLHLPPEEYTAPWQGREIWLEAAIEQRTYSVTEQGCEWIHAAVPATLPCPELSCHYGFREEEDRILIGLERTWEDLQALTDSGRFSRAIGLYQQLGKERRLPHAEAAANIQNLPPPPP